ncbi:hypothetical protein MMC15_000741 [Xylographa vitiligo]|nr:hypothetical protein [Xylographa vitiligo]
MFGVDFIPDFWDPGFELFRDRSTFEGRFLAADIFDGSSSLVSLHGQIDIVHLGSFLHLFDWHRQVKAAKAVIKLSKVGALIIGSQVGGVSGREIPSLWGQENSMFFFYNQDTVERLWRQVESETNTSWAVDVSLSSMEARLPEKEDYEWMGPDARGMVFDIMRTA